MKLLTLMKMRTLKFFTLSCIVLLSTSCAKHIHVSYQPNAENTGKIVLKPNQPTPITYVTINETLVVDKEKVKSVTISDVPNGEHMVHFSSAHNAYKEKLKAEIPVQIENGKEVTKLIDVPPYSSGYWIYSSLGLVPLMILLLVQ